MESSAQVSMEVAGVSACWGAASDGVFFPHQTPWDQIPPERSNARLTTIGRTTFRNFPGMEKFFPWTDLGVKSRSVDRASPAFSKIR